MADRTISSTTKNNTAITFLDTRVWFILASNAYLADLSREGPLDVWLSSSANYITWRTEKNTWNNCISQYLLNSGSDTIDATILETLPVPRLLWQSVNAHNSKSTVKPPMN